MQENSSNCMNIFSKFINQIQQLNHKEILERSQTIYSVRQFKLNQLTPQMAVQIYDNIYLKFNRSHLNKQQLNWFENQLRIFVWILVLYVEINKNKIQVLSNKDWEFFKQIFPHKKEILFEYQSINILKQHGQAKKWIESQDKLFGHLVNEKGLKCKWSQLAKLLYIESEKKYFRTPKQCRQRWLNHLDPSKTKCEWQPKQDFILISYVYEKQKKWAEISKILENKRNQHSIKNRFKSLITKQQKLHDEKLQQSKLIAYTYQRYSNYYLKSSQEPEQNDKYKPQQKVETKQTYLTYQTKKQDQLVLNFQTGGFMNKYPFNWVSRQKQRTIILPQSKTNEYGHFTMNKLTKNKLINNSGNQLQSLQNLPLHKTYTEMSNFYESQFNLRLQFKSQGHLIHQQKQQIHNLRQFNSCLPLTELPIQTFVYTDNLNQDNFFPSLHEQRDSSISMIPQKPFYLQIPQQEQLFFNKSSNFIEDDKQRSIRADIFTASDPFEILRYFFITKNSSNEEKKSQFGYQGTIKST